VATDTPTRNLPAIGSECPNCGTHADPGQLVCLECGARLALDYRRPRGWRPAAAVIALVLLVAAAAFVITLIAVDDDSKDEVAASKAGQATAPATRAKKKSSATAKKKAKQPSSATPTTGGVRSWPSHHDGFTVVLLSSGDEASAREFARNARDDDVDAGVLHSDDYASLEKGFWIVFAGDYDTRAQADRAAARMKGRFSGSYSQFVQGSKSG
jgi:septal ring-binding cell division protein DamX